ncbi:unnamed protein product [Parascedosporium putredinis]|uniref:Outer spore wall protein RRT8 n=1 Tax=Parascedosporium putredinis TaxID=1442378 RepID=A0A9P1GVY5_9PEZI|nr:unnamed protein product [Parascedosporium putredinis]CAI7988040.1 unnamed protein product [Parascedosporium putredinis]
MSQNSAESSRKGAVGAIQSKAQEVLQEDFDKAKVLVADAAKSQAYLYPIKGFFYFVTRPSIWKPFAVQLGPYMLLSVSVVSAMFFFTYLPQLAILVFVNGPLAVFTTVILILNESATITNLIARNWFLHDALIDTFDGTLVAKNATGIVQEGRELKPGSTAMERLGRIVKTPLERFSLKSLVRYLMYLPLNFIPIVGTVAFLVIQGRARGKAIHSRYFQLKKWSDSRQSDWLRIHVAPYTAFGLVATLLEMIPFLSILFAFTNTTGAALWAADIEADHSSMSVDDLRSTANGNGATSSTKKSN